MLPPRDAALVRIVDAALADATRRAARPDGGSWLACRPGCTPCCHGVFRISALDAERLRAGYRELQQTDPGRAEAIGARAGNLVNDLLAHFPGDPATGALGPEDERWEEFADLAEADAPCPVLDPSTGRCELYTHRPLTCRIFGPPVQNEGGIGVCELCYQGATREEVLHGEMYLDHQELEGELEQEAGDAPAGGAETVIAWSLLHP